MNDDRTDGPKTSLLDLHGPRARGQAEGKPWSVVIRPQPVLLADLEHRLRHDAEFSRAMAKSPDFLAPLARAVLARDASARARFASPHDLAAHLDGIRRR